MHQESEQHRKHPHDNTELKAWFSHGACSRVQKEFSAHVDVDFLEPPNENGPVINTMKRNQSQF